MAESMSMLVIAGRWGMTRRRLVGVASRRGGVCVSICEYDALKLPHFVANCRRQLWETGGEERYTYIAENN